MKKKIRVLMPQIVLETLEQDTRFFEIQKEKLCNEILLKFSSMKFLYDPQDFAYEDKEYLQFSLNTNNQRYYQELIREKEIKEAELLRKIFLNYTLLHPILRELNIFGEKVSYIKKIFKEKKTLKIDTNTGLVEGEVNKIYRCKTTNYLKIQINEKDYYIGQIRIVSYL